MRYYETMLTEQYLVEKRPHPLMDNVEQYIYCFPSSYRYEHHGRMGLSIIVGENPDFWEGAVFGGMTQDGYGGRLAHDRRLLPERCRKWSKEFKNEAAVKAWIRKAARIYG